MPLLSTRGRRTAAAAVLAAAFVASAGCADFDSQQSTADQGTFSEVPSEMYRPQAPTAPESPDDQGGDPPTGPCVDPNPSVIATCLDQTAGVRPADAQGKTTYVAERVTGKIILSKRYGPQRAVATVPVDGSGDGGLVDFELSPTWLEDQMIFALITTPSDNRVVRIAPSGSVKPILTGIPKGATGNMGSIAFTGPDTLTVATGDAGDPGAAQDRSSLAGKIFEINPNQPAPKPDVLASGLGSNVALCRDPDNGQMYVTDSGRAGDRLSLVTQKSLKTLWTWADRPGLTGCATGTDTISVAVGAKKRIDVFTKPDSANPVLTEPTADDVSKTYGAVGRMTTFGGAFQLATINKTLPGMKTESFDDRVAVHVPQGGSEDRT
ncbi:PQQ-dependent sugar dehydrogenase [Gordonia humi]|uniref:Glucose/arabinose dehydrogenase n=1 Tax=Gordonia humi TaxID=686429 RepID=A0A840FAH3_9ACTN|nr:PQQ-dependent sugar dehydrogenase [Gordonia humi]MBB4137150.1 glucose/arabinose dehydrogenase [Gordonia humi]